MGRLPGLRGKNGDCVLYGHFLAVLIPKFVFLFGNCLREKIGRILEEF
jgi:hypothetical protein